jgi:ribonucleoside-diphosphate reductase alpha chain
MINDATSGGLEPVFALSYIRNIEGNMHYIMAPAFEEIAKKEGFWTEDLPQLVADNHGSAQGIDQIPEKWQKVLKTAMEIDPVDHVKMQGVMQKHVDNSISKTINLPKDASQEYISDIMLKGWLSGLKGMTIYRDGCREGQVLTLSNNDDGTIETGDLHRGDWAPIAEDTTYHKKKVYIGCGKLTLFIGWSASQQRIQEFWVKRSGSGGCERNLEDMTIAMSGMMRLGGNINNIDRAFEGVGTCTSFVAARGKGRALSKGNNCGNAILFAIKEFLSEMEEEEEVPEDPKPSPKPIKPQVVEEKISLKVETAMTSEESVFRCPECNEPLGLDAHQGGCITCKSCGYSKCD